MSENEMQLFNGIVSFVPLKFQYTAKKEITIHYRMIFDSLCTFSRALCLSTSLCHTHWWPLHIAHLLSPPFIVHRSHLSFVHTVCQVCVCTSIYSFTRMRIEDVDSEWWTETSSQHTLENVSLLCVCCRCRSHRHRSQRSQRSHRSRRHCRRHWSRLFHDLFTNIPM